jgi:hypothetical protein
MKGLSANFTLLGGIKLIRSLDVIQSTHCILAYNLNIQVLKGA